MSLSHDEIRLLSAVFSITNWVWERFDKNHSVQ